MWKWAYRILAVIAAIFLLLRLGDRLVRRSAHLPEPPNPNGYEVVIAAERTLVRPPGDLADLGTNAIQAVVQNNREALGRIHAALRMESGVPLPLDRQAMEKLLEEQKSLKRLPGWFALQAKAGALEGRPGAASESLLDLILLGQMISRGGVLNDGLTGLAVETLGVASLQTQIPNLDSPTCRSLLRELEAAEGRRSAAPTILKTQETWATAHYGLVHKLGQRFLNPSGAAREKTFLERDRECVRRTRKVMLGLAARSFELETGAGPSRASDLVPRFLKAVPIDPMTGAPMEALPASKD